MIEEEQEKRAVRDYIGQTLWMLTAQIAGLADKESPMPQYIELMYPEMVKGKESAQEIKDHILERLGG